MPYIKQEDRKQFDSALKQIKTIPTKGDLEYCIYKLMLRFMETRETRYSHFHDAVYAAIHCGEEYERRFLGKRMNSVSPQDRDIETESREQFDPALDQIKIFPTKGDLEYCIFKLMRKFVATTGDLKSHDAVDAAIHCGNEFRKRFLDKRENQAIQENGDVEAWGDTTGSRSIHDSLARQMATDINRPILMLSNDLAHQIKEVVPIDDYMLSLGLMGVINDEFYGLVVTRSIKNRCMQVSL
jgi:hypothetical protein